MLRSLRLRDVGPAPALDFEFAPRLNILTGDNGLGKSFILDTLWYALTWTWAGRPAYPRKEAKRDTSPLPGENYLTSEISYQIADGVRKFGRSYRCFFHASAQDWAAGTEKNGKWLMRTGSASGEGANRMEESLFPGDGIVIYARVDGGFSVWDCYRNRGRFPELRGPVETRLPAFHLSREQVWDGPGRGEKPLYNGLIYDWVRWQQQGNGPWNRLVAVLESLSGAGGVETLTPDAPTRVGVDDARDIPTIKLPYGTVPLTLASAGMRRICALAYMLVWAWYENQRIAEEVRRPPSTRITLLLDEVEAHLHPLWQRRLLPALMRVLAAMQSDMSVQVFAATHSPLVLASLESSFVEEQDDLFHFALDGTVARVTELAFAKQGDASNWLVSESFGLQLPRSVESERAISTALAFMANDDDAVTAGLAAFGVPPARRKTRAARQKAIHELLVEHVPGHDDFWPTWVVTAFDGRPPRRP